MNGQFTKYLREYEPLIVRSTQSTALLSDVSSRIKESNLLCNNKIVVFAVGSLARGEYSKYSDLDLFVSTNDEEIANSKIHFVEVFSELIKINRELNLPHFSNDGQFMRIFSLDELKNKIGASIDDSENYFTARMLMLLEAKPLLNSASFYNQQRQLVEFYFRDGKGRNDFRPLFLINDLLRYWRTLCLNYEETRHDETRKWRKKNINLKFSRKITVFSTVLALISNDKVDFSPGSTFWELTPLERLAHTLDKIGDINLIKSWRLLIENYESFLKWKEDDSIESKLIKVSEIIKQSDYETSTFLFNIINHDQIKADLRRYITI